MGFHESIIVIVIIRTDRIKREIGYCKSPLLCLNLKEHSFGHMIKASSRRPCLGGAENNIVYVTFYVIAALIYQRTLIMLKRDLF